MNNRKNTVRAEKQQQRLDAGVVAARFPEVESIVISMMYNQKGLGKSLPRTVHFFPGSSALFRINCLSKDCIDGGFDLTQVLTAMIGNRRKNAKGELICEGGGASADHSAIAYEVLIQYT